MPLESWIAQYGYVAMLLGGLFEGETLLVLGGLAAHRGLLDLRGVIAAAALGALCANQALFHLGRLRGEALLVRWPRLRPRAARVLELAHRHQRTVLLLYRFAVGARAMTPFVLGMSGVRPWHFSWLDSLVTLVWACAVGGAGFWVGDALERAMPEIRRAEHTLFAVLAALGALGWLARRVWARRRLRRAAR
jgi:membrane protein DedA with SNARE-associated domain